MTSRERKHRSREERRFPVGLRSRAPAPHCCLCLARDIWDLMGVLPAPCLRFLICTVGITGHGPSPHRAGPNPTSRDSPATSLCWHQWRNLLLNKGKRGAEGNASREDVPIFPCPVNARGLALPLGRHQSFSFLLGQVRGG